MFDYIIIGAGPAGIQLAYYLAKQNVSYLVLESGQNAGTFYETYPRHRQLISINKRHTGSDNAEYNLRHDWNSLLSDEKFPLFGNYDQTFFPNADNLVRYLNDYVDDHQLNIAFRQHVKSINKENDVFEVLTRAGAHYMAKQLIISTGVPKPFIPSIPGIELVEQYESVSVDANDFEKQRVLIIGKGNSAFETADHLINSASLIHICSPNPLNLAWKTHYVGHLRAVNNNLLDTYQLKSQNAVLDANIETIRPQGDRFLVTFNYTHANGECEEIVYDRVICCTGFGMDLHPFGDTARPQLMVDDRFPQLNAHFESVNVKGMYFAGTLTQAINYRKGTSGFIHGFRYNSKALANMLMHRHEQKPFPAQQLAGNSRNIAEAILNRINESSALWQQHGFIVDVIEIDVDTGTGQHIQELPRQYCHELWANNECYLLIALDFGDEIDGDPFNQTRVHKDDAAHSQQSKFLHPIIYLCKHGEEVAEHHIIEDLEAEWTDEEVHLSPLMSFIEQHVMLQPDVV